ncbi:UL16-binding protein 1-like [Peromyscus californicus insignis]|uniref:UL16-binding protein 1-like n=1 Tax=Peromyscus californicus insignis TaxID=564181 RepID=UPI0022A66A78|nr:UL16-binding protein 1-like [Peromyscus californicus insignis]
MAKASAPRCNGSRKLNLLVLLNCLGYTLPNDAASLYYSFTVDKSGSGPWRHQVQGQLNKENFIYCDSTNNCHANGVLGDRLKATKTWEPQVDTLKDGVDLFKQQMVYMKQENNTIREPLTLQAMMYCGHEVDGKFNGSWDFDLNGHKMFHVDSITGKWTEVEPGSRWMKEMWENNRDVTNFLKMTSQGDCRSWLEEIKSHWEEKLEPTASPIATPDMKRASSLAINPNTSVPLIILPYTVFLWFLRRIRDNEGLQQGLGLTLGHGEEGTKTVETPGMQSPGVMEEGTG